MNTLIGIKQNMTSKYNELGRRMPVTRIVAENNVIVATTEDRVHLGFGKKKRFKKPENAFVSAVGYAPRKIREVKITKSETEKSFTTGDQVTVSIFEPGDIVKVTGVIKGRGFAGGVKRYNFRGGPKTHGQSDRHRAIGSIGQTTTPGRVFKGKRMAGHYGATNITITGLVVVEVDETSNAILVKGSVPGAKNGQLIIQKTGIMKNYSPLQSRESKAAKEAEKAKEEQEIKDAEGKETQVDVSSQPAESIDETASSEPSSEPAVEAAPAENIPDYSVQPTPSQTPEPSQPSDPIEDPKVKEAEDAK